MKQVSEVEPYLIGEGRSRLKMLLFHTDDGVYLVSRGSRSMSFQVGEARRQGLIELVKKKQQFRLPTGFIVARNIYKSSRNVPTHRPRKVLNPRGVPLQDFICAVRRTVERCGWANPGVLRRILAEEGYILKQRTVATRLNKVLNSGVLEKFLRNEMEVEV